MRVLAIVHQPDAGPGVFAEAAAALGHQLEFWRPANQDHGPPSLDPYAAVMTFGGGMHPDQEDVHPWLADEKRLLADAIDRAIPVLAICLGAELLAQAAGGSARRSRRPEIGWYPVGLAAEAGRDRLIGPLPRHFDALQWHSYESAPPPGAIPLARSETCLQAFRVNRCAWGVQFHAEVTLRTFESWLESYADDPDAVEMGIDPQQLRDRTRRAIETWNRMGRELCTRFLEIAPAGKSPCATGSPRVGEARANWRN